MTRWLETDSLSNQNIASALAIGAYTADADRMILCQWFADQVAGGGDYIFYLTHQIAGAGSAYRYVPKTTATVDAGVTAIAGQSIMVAVRSGDVLTLYLDGLAGDTTTPDTTVRWFELAALRPTTADRTLDVSAGGEAGVDWANVGSPTTTVGLSGTTVKAVTDGVGLADDAITSAKFDESTAFPLKAADAGITYIMRTGADGDTAETLSDQLDATATAAALATVDGIVDDILVDTGTTLPAAVAAVDSDVWTYATRTLTSTAAETTAAVSGSTLNITARATYQATLSGLTISASWSKIWLTIKSDVGDADASSVVQIVESNPGVGTDGLLFLNGAAGTAAQGSLTVNQGAGTIDIVIADEATDDLTPAQGLIYDIKQLVAGVTTVLTDGAANIAYTATAAIA